MCDFCDKSYEQIEYRIYTGVTKNGIQEEPICICPNCVAEQLLKGWEIPKGEYIGEITIDHQRLHQNCVKIVTPYDDALYLTPIQAKRFLGHQLLPFEMKELIDENGRNIDSYDFHDDFYSKENGVYLATQPLDEELYIKELSDYAKVVEKNDKSEYRVIKRYLDFIKDFNEKLNEEYEKEER